LKKTLVTGMQEILSTVNFRKADGRPSVKGILKETVVDGDTLRFSSQ
jgi:hypothetical protein